MLWTGSSTGAFDSLNRRNLFESLRLSVTGKVHLNALNQVINTLFTSNCRKL